MNYFDILILGFAGLAVLLVVIGCFFVNSLFDPKVKTPPRPKKYGESIRKKRMLRKP